MGNREIARNTYRRPTLCTLLCLGLLAILCGSCQESLEERCAREAEAFTLKQCPTQIAENITIDSLTFDMATRTLCYSYTLSGALDDTAVIRRSEPRQQMLKELKNATSLRQYKDAGYNFRYTYYSTQNPRQKLFEATFQKKDYR